MEKLHKKFSALNVDFDEPSLDFLGSRKPAQGNLRTKASKSGTPVKVVILSLLASFFLKTAADRHGHATYQNKH